MFIHEIDKHAVSPPGEADKQRLCAVARHNHILQFLKSCLKMSSAVLHVAPPSPSQSTGQKPIHSQEYDFLKELESSSSPSSASPSSHRRWRGVVIGTCVAGTVGLGALLLPFVAPGWRRIALPYLPATTTQVQSIFSFLSRYTPDLWTDPAKIVQLRYASDAAGRPHSAQGNRVEMSETSTKGVGRGSWITGKRFIDLGSGDGRLVISAAQHGMQATGVELNWWLVIWSRLLALKQGFSLQKRTQFFLRDIFKTDVSSYDVIVLFGVDGLMDSIQRKLQREMRDTALFLACRFPLPHCAPALTLGAGVDTVWVYRKADLMRRT